MGTGSRGGNTEPVPASEDFGLDLGDEIFHPLGAGGGRGERA